MKTMVQLSHDVENDPVEIGITLLLGLVFVISALSTIWTGTGLR